MFHIFLDSSQHEWFEYFVQPLNMLLTELPTDFVLGVSFDILREPFLKVVMVVKKVRHDEV